MTCFDTPFEIYMTSDFKVDSTFHVLDDGGDRETRVDAGDPQDNEYLLDQIVELGARVTQLEKLLEGKVEHASTEAEVLGALAANILRRKA